MFNDFIIQNNFSLLNTTLNIEKNCKISYAIYNSIKAGQIYTSTSQIKIHGGIIQNSKIINVGLIILLLNSLHQIFKLIYKIEI